MTIATYDYTYGAGNVHNRQIQFCQIDGNIQANVYTLTAAGIAGDPTVVLGNNIKVEMESTTEKMNRVVVAKAQHQTFHPRPDQFLNKLGIVQQTAVLQSLHPNGSRRIEVQGDIRSAMSLNIHTSS